MRTVTVTAIRAFEYDGRAVEPGEAMKMPILQAAAHAYRGHISLTKVARPTYQTRDMVAAPVVAAIDAEPEYTPEPEPVPRRRGRPRRTPPPDEPEDA